MHVHVHVNRGVGPSEFKLLDDVTHNDLQVLRPSFASKVQRSIDL